MTTTKGCPFGGEVLLPLPQLRMQRQGQQVGMRVRCRCWAVVGQVASLQNTQAAGAGSLEGEQTNQRGSRQNTQH